MIRIAEILDPSCILTDLPAGGKDDALRAMTDRLAELGRVEDGASIHRLLMDRENLMTTGVRRGFAFPHAFDARIERSFLTLGVSVEGVGFDSLDNEAVHFVFLLLGPPDNQQIHLRILARVSRLTGQPDMLRTMLDACGDEDAGEALLEVIRGHEQQLKAHPYALPDARE
jgi:mannitol/fructose-specific phosphotransferase system IIA component (Ntr-type)